MKSTLTTLPLLLLASTTTLANPVAIPVANPVAEPRPESSYNPKANPGNFVCTANGPGIHILKQSDCINFLRNLPITQGMGQVKFNDELTWDPTAPWVVPQPDKHCKVRVYASGNLEAKFSWSDVVEAVRGVFDVCGEVTGYGGKAKINGFAGWDAEVKWV